MESIFGMGAETELPGYLQALMQYLGSSYICLWSHHYLADPTNSSNLLVFSGGFYRQHNNYYELDHHRPLIMAASSSSSSRSPPSCSSSSGSAANRHFQDYTQSTFTPINDRVPGHALMMNHPYVELNESELLRMASTLPQRLFYQEAKIKRAVFMGCRSGEIELGWSNLTAQQLLLMSNIESEMMKLFPDDFSSHQLLLTTSDQHHLINTAATSTQAPLPIPIIINPPPPSSPTSSVRSSALSLENSPDEYSSFLLNLTNTTTSSPAFSALHPQMIMQQPYVGFMPSTMEEDAAMTRAFLAVFTSPTPTSTTTTTTITPPAAPAPAPAQLPRRTTAFKRFSTTTPPPPPPSPATATNNSTSSRLVVAGQSMFKRAITYYRRSFMMRSRDHNMNLASRPTSTQLHHMISERRRREKINHSFHSLRSLLPPDAKKDKASVLSRTKEYMSSLIAQVEELAERNRHLESILHQIPAAGGPLKIKEAETIPSDQRLDVRLTSVEETTEQHRVVELQVTLRGSQLVSDIVVRVLEFLRQLNNLDLIALEANNIIASAAADQTPRFSRALFRLQIIQGDEWDEAAFQEAVRRVVADLAQ